VSGRRRPPPGHHARPTADEKRAHPMPLQPRRHTTAIICQGQPTGASRGAPPVPGVAASDAGGAAVWPPRAELVLKRRLGYGPAGYVP
jgi:hypothetical protein